MILTKKNRTLKMVPMHFNLRKGLESNIIVCR